MLIKGFSLVELSIVLVILGLLTGGILTGQNLIRAAELRSVTTDFNKYQTAVMTFRDKYFYLPGDMPNATDFWGVKPDCGTEAPVTSGTLTCNGSGDGKINYVSEQFRFWEHLANAGLIEGSYAGVKLTSATTGRIAGQNIPVSRLSPGGYDMGRYLETTASTDYFPAAAGEHLLHMGNFNGAWEDIEILTPEEVWNIDQKMDDGLPATGRLLSTTATSANTPNCTTTDDATTARYNVISTDVLCKIISNIGF